MKASWAVCLLLNAGLLFFGGCTPSPAVLPTGTVPLSASAVPNTSASTAPEEALPHDLYYLATMPEGTFQVWYAAAEDAVLHQVTDEREDVDEFDVSTLDGRVAYLSGNQLYLINADGSGKRLLVSGTSPQENDSAYLYTQKISGLSWSPSGDRLAYGLNGLHVIDLATQEDITLVENVVDQSESGTLLPEYLYKPISWSPDGSYLLVEIDFFEGGTLGTFNLESNQLIRLGGEGIVCCQPAWAPDSASVLVASQMFGIAPAGLWRYDALSGEEMELIHHTSADGTVNFVNWPLELPDGNLRYFFNNLAEFPSEQPPLLMVASDGDGVTGRKIIRTEYFDNFEVLWAEDGSLAAAVQPATGVQPSWPRTGPIVIIPASSEPPVPLPAYGYSLRWGP